MYDNVDEIVSMLHDIANVRNFDIPEQSEGGRGIEMEESPKLVEKFRRLIRDAEKELFPGCDKFSKLEFMVHLFSI